MSDAKAVVAARAKEVDALLQKKQGAQAVKVALQKPPFASKDQAVKDKNTATVLRALSSLPEKDITKVTQSLYDESDELTDNLMKYVYRGLSEGQYSAILFRWHAACLQIAGQGPIVRAITDRKSA